MSSKVYKFSYIDEKYEEYRRLTINKTRNDLQYDFRFAKEVRIYDLADWGG